VNLLHYPGYVLAVDFYGVFAADGKFLFPFQRNVGFGQHLGVLQVADRVVREQEHDLVEVAGVDFYVGDNHVPEVGVQYGLVVVRVLFLELQQVQRRELVDCVVSVVVEFDSIREERVDGPESVSALVVHELDEFIDNFVFCLSCGEGEGYPALEFVRHGFLCGLYYPVSVVSAWVTSRPIGTGAQDE
jgi:hypothetical protein